MYMSYRKDMQNNAVADLESRMKTNEPAHDKTKKMTCAPSEDSYNPGHPTSRIRVFAMRLIGR